MTRDIVFPPRIYKRNSWHYFRLCLARCRCGCRSGSEALRCETHDHSHDTAGKHDFEIVAMLHVGDKKSQEATDCQSKEDPKRNGIHFARENSRGDASDETLDGGSDNDANDLGAHGRSEPRGASVNGSQQGSQKQSDQDLVHLSASLFRSLMFYTTGLGFPLTLSLQNQQQNHAHHQIGQNQQDEEAVAAVEARQFLKNAFAMRSYRQAIEVPGDILAELRDC